MDKYFYSLHKDCLCTWKLTSRLANCVCCSLNESFGLTMPVKLLLPLTKLDEIGTNLENTAPLPLFFCQPLNAERPILLCYSFSRTIFLEINNYLWTNTITYNHHHSILLYFIFFLNLKSQICYSFSFVSDLLLLTTQDKENKN